MNVRSAQADGGGDDVGAAETAGGMDKFAGLMRLARVSGNTMVSFRGLTLLSNFELLCVFCSLQHTRNRGMCKKVRHSLCILRDGFVVVFNFPPFFTQSVRRYGTYDFPMS